MNPLAERLQMYYDAEQAILVGGQSYRIGNRTLTRADLAEVRAEIKRLENMDVTIGGRTKRRRTARIILHD